MTKHLTDRNERDIIEIDFSSKYITTGSNYNMNRTICYLNNDDKWVNEIGQVHNSYLTFEQIVKNSKTWIDWVRLK